MDQSGGFRDSFRWDVIRSTPRYAYLVASVAALGGMLFGYDIGVISGAENLLKTHFHLSAGSEELAVSAVLIGSIIGGTFGGKLADRVSRRYALVGLAVVYSVGAVATALAPSLLLFDVFRIVVGIAVGASSMVVPTYIAELAPVQIRGGLVILQQLAISAGIFISYVLDYIVFTAGWGWRPMFAAAVVPGLRSASGWPTSRTRRAGWRCRVDGTRPSRSWGASIPTPGSARWRPCTRTWRRPAGPPSKSCWRPGCGAR